MKKKKKKKGLCTYLNNNNKNIHSLIREDYKMQKAHKPTELWHMSEILSGGS